MSHYPKTTGQTNITIPEKYGAKAEMDAFVDGYKKGEQEVEELKAVIKFIISQFNNGNLSKIEYMKEEKGLSIINGQLIFNEQLIKEMKAMTDKEKGYLQGYKDAEQKYLEQIEKLKDQIKDLQSACEQKQEIIYSIGQWNKKG